jgi:hypothetical protein
MVDEGEERGSRWRVPVIGLASTALTLLASAFSPLSAIGLAKLGGIGLGSVGFLWGSRNYTHRRIRYREWRPTAGCEWTPNDSERLAAFVCGDAVLSATLLTFAVWTFAFPSSWLLLIAAAVAAIAILVSAGRLRDLLESKTGAPPTGTERAEHCAVVRGCRWVAKKLGGIPGVAQADEWVWGSAPDEELSRLATISIVVLAMVAMTQGWVVAPDVISSFNGSDAIHEITDRTDSSQKKGNGSGKEDESGSPGQRESQAKPDSTTPSPSPPGDCRPEIEPENDLTRNAAEKLSRAWRAFSTPIAGCPGIPHRVPGTADSFYVKGSCDGSFWSLGVVSSRGPGVVVLDPAAGLAWDLARHGKLLRVSPRQVIVAGDFHVLYTRDGGWVAIREETTDGHGGIERPPEHCSELEPAKSRYVQVPPGMADLWLQFAERQQPTWPKLDTSRISSGVTYFSFSSIGEELTVATGSCTSPTDCRLEFGRREVWKSGRRVGAVTATRVREFGPR